jgi:hypothetical protein
MIVTLNSLLPFTNLVANTDPTSSTALSCAATDETCQFQVVIQDFMNPGGPNEPAAVNVQVQLVLDGVVSTLQTLVLGSGNVAFSIPNPTGKIRASQVQLQLDLTSSVNTAPATATVAVTGYTTPHE